CIKFPIIFVKKTAMRTPFSPENSLIYRLFIFLVVILTGLILTYIVFLLVVFAQSGFDLALTNESILKIGVNVHLLRLMQILQSFFVFIIPPFILTKLYKENPTTYLNLGKPGFIPALLGIVSVVLMVPVINVLVSWNAGMHLPDSLHGLESWMRASEDAAEKVTEVMLSGTTWSTLGMNLVIVGLLAGVGEEFLFRGLLQSLFAKGIWPQGRSRKMPDWVMHTAIWIVAFLFSVIHLQFYGFIPRLLLGAWFGYLLWWTGSVWVPVLAHFTNNALSTIAVFLENKGLMTEDPDQLGLGNTWWLCLVSGILLIGCIFYLKQENKGPRI
ncbi:MAG: CPBP family intramembrane metalloprotease, partial [Bacteroidales bacterium]|nr:CPBP family intramembrane metalloprotease [Bacteroidales bacterium]